jgi:phosphoribosylformylglycinamidine synthase subunit PurL
MLGLIDDPALITPAGFQQEGDRVFLIGQTYAELGGSEYLKRIRNLVAGAPPRIDLNVEKITQQAVLSAIREKLVRSCHDLSDGGLAVALAECCVMPENSRLGLTARIEDELPEHVLYFSESQSRFIISASPENQKAIEQHFSAANISCRYLGSVGGSVFSLNDSIHLNIEELADIYYMTIPSMMQQ